MAFINKAIENVKDTLEKIGYKKSDEDTKICYTFDSYFCEWFGRDANSLENKTVFIEEFSMVPNKWMTVIYKASIKFEINIYMFGDPNQCDPVEGGSQIHYDYLDSKTMDRFSQEGKHYNILRKKIVTINKHKKYYVNF